MVDSGTGATAVGLALGAALAGAPWTVHGVMLAGDRSYYEAQQRGLTAAFCSSFLPGEGALIASLQALVEQSCIGGLLSVGFVREQCVSFALPGIIPICECQEQT